MSKQAITRRKFFKGAGMGAAAMAGLPLLTTSCMGAALSSNAKTFIPDGATVLFQGDSITDAGRDRKRGLANDARSFGNGYALAIASSLLQEFPEKELTIYNRGISGNKVYQLADRWEEDCLQLEPDVLSILIGVNDYWHFRNGNYDGTPEIYETDFRALLSRTLDKFPDLKLVICQPFILPGTSAVDESWLEPFSAYQEIAEKLAKEFSASWVPFQEVFDEATGRAEAAYWAGDGVHPSMAGASLMAKAWLEAL